jgi:hypothetical protein
MNIINIINDFVGVDWSLDKIIIDDVITIYLSEERGHKVIISCYNFIGFSFVGHWDESIIEYIKVEPEGDLINNSLLKIKSLYGDSPLPAGENKRIDGIWYQLSIKLIDGNIIKVACENFTIDM